MPSAVAPSLPIDRAALGRVFTDPRTLVAIEQALQASLNSLPAQIADLLVTQLVLSVADPELSNSRVLTGSAGVTIDTVTDGLIKVVVNVATALGYTPANAADDYVTVGVDADLPNSRQLISSIPGVTLDVGTAGEIQLKIVLNTLLNSDNIVLVHPFSATAGAAVSGGLECDSLRVDQAPTASATASTHSIPININGTVMYMRLSATP